MDNEVNGPSIWRALFSVQVQVNSSYHWHHWPTYRKLKLKRITRILQRHVTASFIEICDLQFTLAHIHTRMYGVFVTGKFPLRTNISFILLTHFNKQQQLLSYTSDTWGLSAQHFYTQSLCLLVHMCVCVYVGVWRVWRLSVHQSFECNHLMCCCYCNVA